MPFTVKAGYEATLANIRDPLRDGAQYLWIDWDAAGVDKDTHLGEAFGG